MRLILAVVVGLTSVAADGVCEDTGSCTQVLNKHHRPPASSRSAGKFPTPPRLFQGDDGVTRAMNTDDDRVRPTGPTDGAEGPNAAPAPATKRGPPSFANARKKIKQKHRTKFRVQFLSPGWRRPDCY